MSNAPWFVERDESEETIVSFIKSSKILSFYPNYQHLFNELNMPEECPIVGHVDNLRKALDAMFSFEVEYVNPGALVEMNAHDKDMYMYRYYHGHIYPSVAQNSHVLKIESLDAKNRYVDIPNALYEYGQMVSHQVKRIEAASGIYFHNTSAYYAALLMGYDETKGESEENGWALAFGNQLSGWVNAMWLTWLLGIDQHALIMAMVLLEIDELEDDEPPEFAAYVWVKYKNYILDRKFADVHFNSTGPYTLDAIKNRQCLNEIELSQQIDKASALLFQIMILDENFRLAEERHMPFNSTGNYVKH